MRDLQNRSLRLRRHKRQLLLAFVLMSTTPALADSSVGPPKLQAASRSTIQTNPFFNPAAQLHGSDIQLASGRNHSTIRLKPIGKAIGLKTLSTSDEESALPQDIGRSKMTIESVPSFIRTNPLIDSSHNTKRPLVAVDIMPARSSASSGGKDRSSTIMLMPTCGMPSGKQTTMVPTVAERPQQKPVLPNATVSESESQQTNQVAARQVDAIPPTETETGNQEPVHFSLSDRESHSDRVSQSKDSAESTAIEVQIGDSAAGDREEDAVTSLPGPTAPSINSAMPVVAETPEPIRFKSAPPAHFNESEPEELDAPTFEGIGDSIISNSPGQPKQNRLAKRYRPPVEVKPVPLKIERSSTDDTPTEWVGVVPAFSPGSVATGGGNRVASTKLEMDLAQVRSLTVGGKLHTVNVADTSVCKVVATSSNQLKLIGTGEGITQLVVLAEGTESGKKPLRRTFQVHVSDAPQVTGHSLEETCELLNRSVQEAFPGCDVIILQRDNQLMVAGRCDTQTSAKKILRMVRRTCLIPVRDELIVQ